MKFLAEVKNKSKEIAVLYAIILIPMWSVFLINTLLMDDALNRLGGIHPRDLSFLGIIEIFTSWMFHSGGNRGATNNSIFSHIAIFSFTKVYDSCSFSSSSNSSINCFCNSVLE